MNLNKNKALFVLLFYSIFLLTFSSEFFLNEFLSARRSVIIHSKKSECFYVSKQFWTQLNDKKEFKLNSNYYDVKSYKFVGDKVFVKVVADNFEQILKKTTESLTKKHQKSRKQNLNSKITHFFSEFTCFNFIPYSYNKQILLAKKICFNDTFITPIFQPPKFI